MGCSGKDAAGKRLFELRSYKRNAKISLKQSGRTMQRYQPSFPSRSASRQEIPMFFMGEEIGALKKKL
jgi:hypothetical protein